ncbi:MAG: hypothetical protein NTY19_43195 [Planctomycetota bacterium]|nr:hypothetical protein [Planctomycetota bacterium]
MIAGCPGASVAQPLIRAHAHNDYQHSRPLLDALDHGFCSVEADIFLVDGQLLVGHTALELKPQRTLQALYLDPLRHRVQDNGGRVYRDGPQIVEKAHAKGRRVRFWATPDDPTVWRELVDAGVDLLNADDLPGLERFLRSQNPGER